MLKVAAFFALMFYIPPVRAYAHSGEAKNASQSAQLPIQARSIGPWQSSGVNLQGEPEKRVQADVVILSSPKQDTFHDPAFYVNLALALIAVLGLVAAFMTLRKLGRQTKAAEDAANAAKIAAESAMSGQRAYVATTCYWTVDSPRHANARFGVALRNVGHLPTANMRNFIDYRIVEGDLPEDFDFPENSIHTTSGSLLVPGDQIHGPHIPKDSWISNMDLLAVQAGTKNVYFFGWVKYFDGFPNTPERITRFCYKVRITGHDDPTFVFHPYKHHNSAE